LCFFGSFPDGFACRVSGGGDALGAFVPASFPATRPKAVAADTSILGLESVGVAGVDGCSRLMTVLLCNPEAMIHHLDRVRRFGKGSCWLPMLAGNLARTFPAGSTTLTPLSVPFTITEAARGREPVATFGTTSVSPTRSNRFCGFSDFSSLGAQWNFSASASIGDSKLDLSSLALAAILLGILANGPATSSLDDDEGLESGGAVRVEEPPARGIYQPVFRKASTVLKSNDGRALVLPIVPIDLTRRKVRTVEQNLSAQCSGAPAIGADRFR
jgi:hypothetical protein